MPVKELTASKSREGMKSEPKKICARCKQTKTLTEYYRNREWEEQLGCDRWCKDCVNRIKTKDGMREYFWENNREWKEQTWKTAVGKAEEQASMTEVYQKSSDDRKAMLLETMACAFIPKLMQQSYKFVMNDKDGPCSYEEAKQRGLIKLQDADPDLKVYSKDFDGFFKPAELEYLETYYKNLQEDVDIATQAHRDYACKLAKASLQANKAQDDFAAGRCDFSVVKDSMSLFDMLSKSANFAPSTKKKDSSSGLGSFGEVCLWLETNGHPMTKPVEWEPDDVDKTINEFRYFVEGLALDQ